MEVSDDGGFSETLSPNCALLVNVEWLFVRNVSFNSLDATTNRGSSSNDVESVISLLSSVADMNILDGVVDRALVRGMTKLLETETDNSTKTSRGAMLILSVFFFIVANP
jgi:hypothetical protein